MDCYKNSSLSRQNFVPLGEGVLFERGRQIRSPSKKRYFDAICCFSVKTVADRYTHVPYHNNHWSWPF